MSPWLIAALVLGVTSASVMVMVAVWRADTTPTPGSSGSIEPTEMQRTITAIQNEHPEVAPRCDATGA